MGWLWEGSSKGLCHDDADGDEDVVMHVDYGEEGIGR